MENKILVETSARHAHLSAEAVEILYGKRILAVSKGLSSTHKEDVLVVLGRSLRSSGKQKDENYGKALEHFMHIDKKFSVVIVFSYFWRPERDIPFKGNLQI